jgi:RNA polymerase sigma-70 factor, ECF subfamily
MTDQEIIITCQEGNMEAFTLLYDLYIDSIYRYILAKTSDVQTAEDLTSEVFFNALKTIHNFVPQQQASVKSWFFRIAHNKVIDCYRTQKNT